MKKYIALLFIISMVTVSLYGCAFENGGNDSETDSDVIKSDTEYYFAETETDLGGENDSFGGSLDTLNAYSGYFDGESTDISVSYVSGSDGCFSLDGNVLTFSGMSEDSVYSLSGKLRGSIVIDTAADVKLELELCGLSLIGDYSVPITVTGEGDVSLTAKKDTENYIYDKRSAALNAEGEISSAVYSEVDTEICGKGSLVLVSENGNGIHSKKDLSVKNLALTVASAGNSLKGNDSVMLDECNTILISAYGDGIKTTDSDINEKGNQRGRVTVSGGTHCIYVAYDGIDSAYDVIIEGEDTELSIYTDKYSDYSGEGTTEKEADSKSENGRNNAGFMSYNGNTEQVAFGGRGGPGGQGGFGGGGPGGQGGFGGMQDGNSDKADYSSKGIKAANEISVRGGKINIKSYDDALHAGSDESLENGENPTGNINITGGTLTLYTNDDAVHASETVTVSGGAIYVASAYEGIEGTHVNISGGYVSVNSSDDGINATSESDTAVEISGGTVYINCTGDGIDSNSRSSYNGIVFSGGRTVIISNSTMNSAIDTEQGYKYSGGCVLAIMPSGGMTNEISLCSNFSSIATAASGNLSANSYITVSVDRKEILTLKMPVSISAVVAYLGSKNAGFTVNSETSASLDVNGVCWNK